MCNSHSKLTCPKRELLITPFPPKSALFWVSPPLQIFTIFPPTFTNIYPISKWNHRYCLELPFSPDLISNLSTSYAALPTKTKSCNIVFSPLLLNPEQKPSLTWTHTLASKSPPTSSYNPLRVAWVSMSNRKSDHSISCFKSSMTCHQIYKLHLILHLCLKGSACSVPWLILQPPVQRFR